MASETAREVAAAKIKRAGDALGTLCKAIWAGDFCEGWHWEIPANHEKDTDCIIGDGLEAGTQGWAEVERLEAALTAERDARERAERERDVLLHGERLMDVATQRGITDCSTPLVQRVQNIVAQVEKAERERDTLRQHNAVLRAECQAGRLRYPKVEHSRACESTRYVMGEDWYCHCGEGELITARQQTDAAGAMGDTEVGRG